MAEIYEEGQNLDYLPGHAHPLWSGTLSKETCAVSSKPECALPKAKLMRTRRSFCDQCQLP